jgi:hypothetical protein
VDAIRMMVAEKAECAWEGRRKRRPRAQREEPGAEDSVEGDSATGVDSTGRTEQRAARMGCDAGLPAYSVGRRGRGCEEGLELLLRRW